MKLLDNMEYNKFLEKAKETIKDRIYVGNSSFETYRESVETFKSKHNNIIEQYWRDEDLKFLKWDFSWQRECRIKGNYFELPEDDEYVVIICRYERETERLKELYGHSCISFEYVEDNHASDYIAECYAGFQLMSDFEII